MCWPDFFFMLTLGAYARYAEVQSLRSKVQSPEPGVSSPWPVVSNKQTRDDELRTTGHASRFTFHVSRIPDHASFYYVLTLLLFALGLMSKPTVVTLPFVLLLLDYWPLGRFGQPGRNQQPRFFGMPRRLIVEKIPLLALAAGACAMTVLAERGGIVARAHVPMLSRLGNAVVAYAVYLRQMVWPARLAAFYPQPEKGPAVGAVAFSFLLLALVTGGVLACWRKRRWLLTGWFWYLGMLAPMIGLVQVGAFAHADRITYLPQIGLYLLLAWTAAELSIGWPGRRVALAGAAAIILVALMLSARTQTGYWRDSETLWTHTLACTTNNDVANNNLGFALSDQGRLDEAIPYFQMALQCEPGNAQAHNNLGSALFRKGRVDEAITRYREALLVRPDYASAHDNLGVALLRSGKPDEAVAEWKRALHLNPGNTEAHRRLADRLIRMGRAAEALPYCEVVVQAQPEDAHARFALGEACLAAKRPEQAAASFEEALRLAANAPECLNALAWVYATSPQAELRNGAEAVRLAERACTITRRQKAALLDTLAAAYAEAGRFEEAVKTAEELRALALSAHDTSTADTARQRSELYKAGKPYRDE